MTTNPPTDFDGCRRACRTAGAHTLVRGECEHAPEPEPTVSLSRVYTDVDGIRSIGFDRYTVAELADLIEPALRAVHARLGPNALAMLHRGELVSLSGGEYAGLAREAAHAIVHRNDDQPPAAVPGPSATRAADRDRIAAALREHWLCTVRDEADADGNLPCRCGDWREPGAEVDDENDWDSHLAAVALAVLPPPTDRAAVLREAADVAEDCISLFDDADDEGATAAGALEGIRDRFRRMADEAQPAKPDRCPHGCDTSTCPCLACEADEAQQQPGTERRVYAWAQTIDTADGGATVHIPGVHHGGGPETTAIVVSREDVPVLAAMLTEAGGARRVLTPDEYSAAWHAVEGSAGEEGADPGTVLHAVLDRLGIDVPGARRAADDEQPDAEAQPAARPECAHCWREIENRGTPSMGSPGHDRWVHIPGGFEPCFPQRGADSPRAEPRATEDAPQREPHPTEADMRHALAVFARFHGRDTAAAQPDGEA